MKNKTIFGFNSLVLSFLFILIGIFFPLNLTFAQPYACFPTCDGGDMRFFVFAGDNLNSFIETNYVFGIRSPGDSSTLEIGIFDGDDATGEEPFPGVFLTDWDFGGASNITATLYADPTGEGAQTIQIAQWSGDGSFGDNMGSPMLDNDWYNITLTNTDTAMTPDGDFRYTLVMESIAPESESINQFKIRTDGTMIILPFQEFAFFTNIASEADTFVLWPNLTDEDFTDPACVDQDNDFLFVCGMLDPNCCIGGGPYDGTWKFFIDVPEGEGVFNVWDGDFDFGSSTQDPDTFFLCIPDGVDVDTDDANTPNLVPEFAEGTGAVPEGINPAAPTDDICRLDFQFPPSVFYSIITPSGQSFNNSNPSGSEEWELFNIGNVGDVDVPLELVPGGIWTMMVMGTDLANLNGLRFDYPVVAVNEMGDPVPLIPGPPAPVPTLNEWGLLALSAFVLLISIYYLRFREKKAC